MTTKITKFLFVSLIFLSSLLHAQDSGDQIFDNSVLHEVRFEFAQSNYWSTLVNNFESHSDPFDPVPYLMGKVTIDGETVDSVGVRFKGFTSYPDFSDKKPIKIDFNEFVPGKKYDGLRKLNLNNSTGDPSMQRDVVCYDLHRSSGVKASRTSYAKVYFNDEYWGLYQTIEQVDKEFLQRNFSNDQGNLFKNLSWSYLDWMGNNSNPYKEIYSLKTNKTEDDWSGFINLMDVINNTTDSEFEDQIEEVFNVNLFLKVLAVDVATNNWDSYLEHGRNWYLYEDTNTGIFHWIPWDYNFALGGGAFSGGGGCDIFPRFIWVPNGTTSIDFYNESFGTSSSTTFNWDFDDGTTSTEENPNHTFASPGSYNVCLTIIKDANCQDQLCEIVNTNDDYNSCQSIVNGTCPHPVGKTFALVLNFLPDCCEVWGEDCEDFYGFFTSNGSGGFPIDQRENEGILIERLLNIPAYYDQYLTYFCDLDKYHFKEDKYHALIDDNKLLIEDAVQADPNSLFSFEEFEEDIGDQGIKLLIANRIDQLSEELDSVASCLDNFTVIAAQEITINELVASNDSTSMIFDEANEYDDWIELYNNTTEEIDLSGAFLSDSPSDPFKWQFPTGTNLQASEYLIIWADNDTDQPGLHCNFKLNKAGDEVFLSNSDGTNIDSISFDEQVTNIAFARRPNGTGNFVFLSSTFNRNNDEATATRELSDQFSVDVYPVPASDYLQVDIQNKEDTRYSIDLISITGQLLLQNVPTLSNQARLDLKKWEDGFYFLNIRDEDGNKTVVKFVKAQR